MKRPWKDRVGDFMAGKGFYIVLFLCVAAIGISGYYLFSSMSSISSDLADSQPVAGQIQVTVTSPPAPSTPPAAQSAAPSLTAEQPRVSRAPRPAVSDRADAPQATPAATQTTAPAPAALVFTWPVKGEVLTDYTIETLAYDVTMKDWRVHPGLDIAAETGLQIRAAAAGTVSRITQDPLMGTTLVIDHGDGLESVYANLEDTPAVSVGDSVYTGDLIGRVGASARAESSLPSHLHFALRKNGEPVSPLSYLPEQH